MNKTIFKYRVPLQDFVAVDLPRHFKLLHVGCTGDDLWVWAEVDRDATMAPVTFAVRGTGHPLNGNEGHYVGTALMRGGSLVRHVYAEQLERHHA